MLSYWKGLELEVDKMDYGFGTSYEIECESSDPDRAKEMLEEFLNGNSIRILKVPKFVVSWSQKLPQQVFEILGSK